MPLQPLPLLVIKRQVFVIIGWLSIDIESAPAFASSAISVSSLPSPKPRPLGSPLPKGGCATHWGLVWRQAQSWSASWISFWDRSTPGYLLTLHTAIPKCSRNIHIIKGAGSYSVCLVSDQPAKRAVSPWTWRTISLPQRIDRSTPSCSPSARTTRCSIFQEPYIQVSPCKCYA
jgi:hypothetical protein